jgi:N-acyl-D-aspartate/D-glutamate deacylase
MMGEADSGGNRRGADVAHDVVIKGGLVVDGSGAPGRAADVGIDAGRITEIGPDLPAGDATLDASDCVVAPGFIDIHTHYDAQVFWDPSLTPSCYHGVTTVVSGSCGFSLAPTRAAHREMIAKTLERVEDMSLEALDAGIAWDFETFPEYLDVVERRGLQINFSAFLGHTALRIYVMGRDAFERTATEDEIAAMERELAAGLEAGAAGFATSFTNTHYGVDGLPIPSRVASEEEIERLFAVASRSGRGVVQVSLGPPFEVDRLYEVSPGMRVPITYGALLTSPSGEHRRRLALHDDGWAKGAQVYPQVTPRPLVFATSMRSPFVLNANPAFAEIMDADEDTRRRAYADPAFRAAARAGFEHETTMVTPHWDRYQVAESAAHPEVIDLTVEEIARRRGVSPVEALLDLALDEPGLDLRVRSVVANDDEPEVATLLETEHCVLGLSDAGAHGDQLCDAPQATDFLGGWVRDRGILDIPRAVRRLTGEQADLFGFADRGYIREGLVADVTVFSPDEVGPGPTVRVNDFPSGVSRLSAPAPTGVRHVVVNGTPIRRDDEAVPASPMPGRIARPSPRV